MGNTIMIKSSTCTSRTKTTTQEASSKTHGKAGSVKNELPPANATFPQEIKPFDPGLVRDNDGLHHRGKLSVESSRDQRN